MKRIARLKSISIAIRNDLPELSVWGGGTICGDIGVRDEKAERRFMSPLL